MWNVLSASSPVLSDFWDGIFSLKLAMYSEKFDEFQGTVSKSNGVYASFKQDMDKVSITPLVHVAYYHVISKHGDHIICTRFMLESCLLDV